MDWPKGVAKPAQRALIAAGISSLDDLPRLSEADLSMLHGMCPKAIHALIAALAEKHQKLRA